MCCNNNNRAFGCGFFQNYQAFWIVVVIAVVVIWVHYAAWSAPCLNGCNNNCGCNDGNTCGNSCYNNCSC